MSTNPKHNTEYTDIREVKDVFIAKLNHDGIIEVELDNKNMQVEKEHLVLLRQVIHDIGEGKKMGVYFKASDFLGISKEAREYAALEESSKYTYANAVFVKSLASRLLFNAFLNLNKPIVPTKGFTSKEEAFKWLKSFK